MVMTRHHLAAGIILCKDFKRSTYCTHSAAERHTMQFVPILGHRWPEFGVGREKSGLGVIAFLRAASHIMHA